MAEKKHSSSDLDNFILKKAHEYYAANPSKQAPCLEIPFQDWEARYFMRGLELGLFEVVSDGLLHYQRLSGHGPKARHTTGFVGYREVVTQFAALTRLIEEYGWPVENALAEPPARGTANMYAFDGLVFDEARPGRGQAGLSWPAVRIAIEAKVTSAQVEKLMRVIGECVQRGFHERHDHRRSEWDDHSKFLGIMEWKPAYFLTVTPEEWKIYLVSWGNEMRFSLAEVEHIPRFGSSRQS